ncbi:phosphoribulokinase [Halobacillus halophilus DSM 2266]|uniref:Phosphoribulokinase n=1 Tax=Halobacillus halophilus (strain ATCC 35676 / DSM 2266 / JCM 20832 / KCTC 3685 / LMG 17431 / NBRC 102448 / NCIMB 2269) TaxID=866895 RepID=I0JJM2_HALH3|nr:phosphoribulokinase [Halobacillus halophilus]CCG44340.1 phosphoribulokinase [Halobacillus halophilus DSM 2266]
MVNKHLREMVKSKWFLVITLVKVFAILIWLPVNLTESTIPFIVNYLSSFENPWIYVYQHPNSSLEFPYPAGLLYLLTLFLSPLSIFPSLSLHLQVFLIQLPTLLADILICYFLLRVFPDKKKFVILIYYCSPIIFVASYIYPNHDLIAIAALFISIFYLIRKQHVRSAVFFGIGFSLKVPVIFTLPMIALYIVKAHKIKHLWQFSVISLIAWYLIVSRFLPTEAYQSLVFMNEDQFKLFDIYLKMENLKVYVAPLFLALLYIQFLRHSKINVNFLLTYVGMLYFVFVLFIPPMPHWYAWSFVFASIYFIQTASNLNNLYLYTILTVIYLSYFTLFYPEPSGIIESISIMLNISMSDIFLSNLVFTLFEGALLLTIWVFYRYGVLSNSLYKVNVKPTVIGIGGDSGVGKTTLTHSLKKMFGKERVLIVEGDGDHKWERGHEKWNKFTHLNPKANFLHQQAATLEKLKNGTPTQRVEYNHSNGTFTSPRRIDPNDFIVMCGLHPLYLAKTRNVMDLKVYIDTDENLRKHWKITRDCGERGYTVEKVMNQIESRIEDAKKYIYPQKNYADIVIKHYTEDSFTLGDTKENPKIKLKIICSTDFCLDPVLNTLDNYSVAYEHDYESNLLSQYLILHEPVTQEVVNEIAHFTIENLYEVTRGHVIQWGEEYDSFIQLMMLICVSEKMKGESHLVL